jgi:hypothetical protein
MCKGNGKMANLSKNLVVMILVFLTLGLVSLACNMILPETDTDPTETTVSGNGTSNPGNPGGEDTVGGMPDLVISTGHAGMVVTGSCVEAYGPITTDICIKNQGDGSADAFLVGSSEGSSWSLGGLNPDEQFCLQSELNLSGETITADVNNQVIESNEGNNGWTIPYPTPPALCSSPEEQQPTPEPDVAYEGVSFSYDPILASSVTPEVVPSEEDAAVEPWNTPEHLLFTFYGYPLADTFHTPQIMVFPTDTYNAINPTAGDVIYQLQLLLDSKPSNPEDIPFLPVFNAAQFMQARVNYFRFQNGSGVRFLTQYGQAAWPINSQDMFYTYQGITDDGNYYISAIFPISHPNLPDPESVTMDDAFYDNFMNYVDGMEDQLNSEPPGSFFPTLQSLDALIESLLVEGG